MGMKPNKIGLRCPKCGGRKIVEQTKRSYDAVGRNELGELRLDGVPYSEKVSYLCEKCGLEWREASK
jgi:DNA-directed RNA polymerase subunit RPC12/RpoP